MNKTLTTLAAGALAFGALTATATPAAAYHADDRWTVRSQICSWFPYWC